MTTPEHTLVGILGAMAMGLHARMGWAVIAFAAVASNVPDFDGLPMLYDMERFEAGHRVWGHNFFAIVASASLLAASQHFFGWIEWTAQRTSSLFPSDITVPTTTERNRIGLTTLFAVGVFFQCVHLLCDMLVSGGQGLSDWHVKPFWPMNNSAFVYPLLPWGDIGPTAIMMGGVIGIAKLGNAKRIAIICLGLLWAYMAFRGYARGMLQPFDT